MKKYLYFNNFLKELIGKRRIGKNQRENKYFKISCPKKV